MFKTTSFLPNSLSTGATLLAPPQHIFNHKIAFSSMFGVHFEKKHYGCKNYSGLIMKDLHSTFTNMVFHILVTIIYTISCHVYSTNGIRNHISVSCILDNGNHWVLLFVVYTRQRG